MAQLMHGLGLGADMLTAVNAVAEGNREIQRCLALGLISPPLLVQLFLKCQGAGYEFMPRLSDERRAIRDLFGDCSFVLVLSRTTCQL